METSQIKQLKAGDRLLYTDAKGVSKIGEVTQVFNDRIHLDLHTGVYEIKHDLLKKYAELID